MSNFDGALDDGGSRGGYGGRGYTDQYAEPQMPPAGTAYANPSAGGGGYGWDRAGGYSDTRVNPKDDLRPMPKGYGAPPDISPSDVSEAPDVSEVEQCDENCGDGCNNSRVRFSNLPLHVTSKELMDFFGGICQVERMMRRSVDKGHWPWSIELYIDYEHYIEKCAAVLSYEDPTAAHFSCLYYKDYRMEGSKINVTMAEKSPPRAPAAQGGYRCDNVNFARTECNKCGSTNSSTWGEKGGSGSYGRGGNYFCGYCWARAAEYSDTRANPMDDLRPMPRGYVALPDISTSDVSEVEHCDENCGDGCSNSRVCFSNLPLDVTTEELMEFFGKKVLRVGRKSIYKGHWPWSIELYRDEYGNSKCAAVLSFEEPTDAHFSCRSYKNHIMRGSKINVTMVEKLCCTKHGNVSEFWKRQCLEMWPSNKEIFHSKEVSEFEKWKRRRFRNGNSIVLEVSCKLF